MASQKKAVFELKNVEILYKAQFEIPLLDIALPQFQANLLKHIFNEFKLKFKDILINNQAISSNLIYFRKILSSPVSHFDTLLGVDEIQTIFANPETSEIAWQPTVSLLDFINNIAKISFSNQSLTLNVHCMHEKHKYNNFINNINTFKIDSSVSMTKGATFSIKQPPWKGGFANIIFDQSLLIPDGLFIFYQAYFDNSIQQYQNLLLDTLKFLHEFIEPTFKLHIKYVGR
jgi:hypothetical protein